MRMRIAPGLQLLGLLCLLNPLLSAQASSKDLLLQFAPAQTSVDFVLGATLHSVHGRFQLKRGSIQFNPAANAISGELVVDAASGDSGNDRRDRRMHSEILESARFPEITFAAESVEGTLVSAGPSNLKVHGKLTIHGAGHEVVVPVRVELLPDHWSVSAHFSLPYVDWGMKNPSTFLLRVERSVEIDVQATGTKRGEPAK